MASVLPAVRPEVVFQEPRAGGALSQPPLPPPITLRPSSGIENDPRKEARPSDGPPALLPSFPPPCAVPSTRREESKPRSRGQRPRERQRGWLRKVVRLPFSSLRHHFLSPPSRKAKQTNKGAGAAEALAPAEGEGGAWVDSTALAARCGGLGGGGGWGAGKGPRRAGRKVTCRGDAPRHFGISAPR